MAGMYPDFQIGGIHLSPATTKPVDPHKLSRRPQCAQHAAGCNLALSYHLAAPSRRWPPVRETRPILASHRRQPGPFWWGFLLARRALSLVVTRRPYLYENMVALTGIEPDCTDGQFGKTTVNWKQRKLRFLQPRSGD
jgi:hypothetical protein